MLISKLQNVWRHCLMSPYTKKNTYIYTYIWRKEHTYIYVYMTSTIDMTYLCIYIFIYIYMYMYIYSSSSSSNCNSHIRRMEAATPATIETSTTSTTPNWDKLRYVTLLIRVWDDSCERDMIYNMCGITNLHVSFAWRTSVQVWQVLVCDATHWYVWHDSFERGVTHWYA